MPPIVPVLLLAFLLSGCVTDPSPTTEPGVTDEEEALTSELHEIVWNGHAVVGLAYDAPAHMHPPERYVRPLWYEGFMVHIEGDVHDLEFSMEWTSVSPGSRVLLMAHSPHGDGLHRMTEYTTGWTDERALCFRIPHDDLAHIPDGHWMPMFHVETGVQVTAEITVRAVGGNASLMDGPHGHDPLDPWESVAMLDATAHHRDHWPCEGALGTH